MTTATTAPLDLTLGEAQAIPLRPFEAQSTGNTWFSISKRQPDGTYKPAPIKFGQPIPALADELPTTATLGDVVVPLVSGTSASGNDKQSYVGNVDVDGLGTKRLTLHVSDIGGGRWNVIARVHGVGGGGGGSKAPVSLDDL